MNLAPYRTTRFDLKSEHFVTQRQGARIKLGRSHRWKTHLSIPTITEGAVRNRAFNIYNDLQTQRGEILRRALIKGNAVRPDTSRLTCINIPFIIRY